MIKIRSQRGFGLVEVMVTVVVVALVLGAVVKVGIAGISNTSASIQRYQATMLAQEGLERVRQIRDTNWIDNSATVATGWDYFDGSSSMISLLDTISGSGKLVYNTTSGRYYFDGSDSSAYETFILDGTEFHRSVTFSKIGNLLPADSSFTPPNNALKASCQVKWTQSGTEKTITLSEVLTNWRPNF